MLGLASTSISYTNRIAECNATNIQLIFHSWLHKSLLSTHYAAIATLTPFKLQMYSTNCGLVSSDDMALALNKTVYLQL